MEKELPSVYANPIQKEFHNVQETYYTERKEMSRSSTKDIVRKIRDIFSSGSFVYKSVVVITTKDGSFETTVVGRTEQSLLTMDGSVIPITSILDIEKK